MSNNKKQINGICYAVDEERKVVVYDMEHTNHGRGSLNLRKVAENMAKVATTENMPVEATFNGTTFQMKPGMSAEDGIKEWEEIRERIWEEYEKSPEYKAEQIADTKKRIEELRKSGIFYTINEERKVIIYDMERTNHGIGFRNLYKVTERMAEIAAAEDMPVEATFNGTTFQMKPGMSSENGIKEWERVRENIQEDKKSPEYKAEQIAEAKRRAEQRSQEMADDALIKDETLNIEGYQLYFDQILAINSRSKLSKDIIDYAVRWGKLMQAEMKKQGLKHLTPELVKDTENRVAMNSLCGHTASIGRSILIETWKYGEELAQNYDTDYDMRDVALLRAVRSNQAQKFYSSYKPSEAKNFEDAVKEGGHIIATVLRDEKLVRTFYNKLASSEGVDEERMKAYIPVLKLPDNNWRTLYQSCDYAKKEILNVKASITKEEENLKLNDKR